MGSNKTDEYDMYVKTEGSEVLVNINNEELSSLFKGEETELAIDYVTENKVSVNIPKNLDQRIFKSKMWDEYSTRCIACGRCNFVCPTCTYFTMQDIFYRDNRKNGERRRIWASCQVDGFTNMAGGHGFRQDKGSRMRFKVMHKVYDFNKRFGYHMCVGCGRCDDICPEYNLIHTFFPGDTLFLRGPYGNEFDVNLYKDTEVIVAVGGNGYGYKYKSLDEECL